MKMKGFKKMEKIMLSEIASALGKTVDFDTEISDVCTDTRNLTEGCLFIAIKGERFDAHDFVPKAVEQGAVMCVTERKIPECPCIVVDDCRKAFLQIAHYYRMKFDIKLIGVTGSVGKTTTKEMISLVMSKKYNTLKTQGNLNNEIGLPKTLLNLDSKCESAVIEMGMSDFGEIHRLTCTASPDIAVITNIGFSHIEKLKSQEGILKAKLEILDGMKENSPLVTNADDKLLCTLKANLERPVYTFGINNPDADYRAVNITENNGVTEFDIVYNDKSVHVMLTAVGKHNVLNAVTAFAVGKICGIDDNTIASAFSEFVPDSLRQNISQKKGQTVITDCYNASPDSMKASLGVLANMKTAGRKIAVLGDMLELGEMSEELHSKVGEMVAEARPDMLFCYGEQSAYIADKAEKSGVKTYHSNNKAKLAKAVADYVKEGDTVLFKASRGMKLEEIITKVYGE